MLMRFLFQAMSSYGESEGELFHVKLSRQALVW